MKIFVYNLREHDEKAYFDRFCAKHHIEYAYTTEYPSPENAALVSGCTGVNIITSPTDATLLSQWHSLGVKYVATRTIGFEHIDIPAAQALGMRVASISYSPNSVANYAIMLMLMACRNISHIIQRARLQDYTLQGKIGRELSNCTVGVVGTGRIGKTVIAHLSRFGCRILAYDAYPDDAVKQDAEYVPLDTLLSESDIITLHAPLNDSTCHLIGRGAIAKMRKGVIIVNTARGALIDTAALIEGLDSGHIGFAALDVLEDEKGLYYFNRMNDVIGNHELAILTAYPNVILTPHTAFYTDEAVSNMVENSLLSLLSFEAGGESPFEVKC
jgi:lactate dehydrogenase-like 2-hydroxyacid dehydrogenase